MRFEREISFYPEMHHDKDFIDNMKRVAVRNLCDEWIKLMEREGRNYLLGAPEFISRPRNPLFPHEPNRIICRMEVYEFDDNMKEDDFFEYSGTFY